MSKFLVLLLSLLLIMSLFLIVASTYVPPPPPTEPPLPKIHADIQPITTWEPEYPVPEPEIPRFPWPPPQSSATVNLPNEFLGTSKKRIVLLGDVDKRLSDALRDAGYAETSYYAVPGGFALVARLEQINSDGTPKTGSDRWAVEIGPLQQITLESYLQALFKGEIGYFRVIVFVITPYPFSQSDTKVSREEAIQWVSRGFNRLPNSVANRTYTKKYLCTALIYEFEKEHGKNTPAHIVRPGKLSADIHLEKSGIMRALRK